MSEPNNDNTRAVMGQLAADAVNPRDPASNDMIRRALDVLTGKEPEGEPTVTEGEESQQPTEGAKGKPPKTFLEAAERLGMKPEEFYALEVAIADGQDAEKFTIGALKDAMKERSTFELERIAFGESKAEQEGELLRSRNELVELLQMLPKGALTPQLVNQIREKHDKALGVERERTLNVIKEWKDENVRATDMAAMREHLTRAGYPENYLKHVSDHRTFKYIRDNMLREQRITRAMELIKPKPAKGSAPSPGGGAVRAANSPTNQPRGNVGEGQKVSQVSQLLKGLVK